MTAGFMLVAIGILGWVLIPQVIRYQVGLLGSPRAGQLERWYSAVLRTIAVAAMIVGVLNLVMGYVTGRM
jgi:hypothetical protein